MSNEPNKAADRTSEPPKADVHSMGTITRRALIRNALKAAPVIVTLTAAQSASAASGGSGAS